MGRIRLRSKRLEGAMLPTLGPGAVEGPHELAVVGRNGPGASLPCAPGATTAPATSEDTTLPWAWLAGAVTVAWLSAGAPGVAL